MALCLASLGLLLTSGRLTRELNHLLRQARHDADNAETLLLAGDIASRVAKRDEAGDGRRSASGRRGAERARTGRSRRSRARPSDRRGRPRDGGAADRRRAHRVGARLRGARPLCREHRQARCTGSRWPTTLGERDALERACLRAALRLFVQRPAGISLSVNLSAPVLLDPLTLQMLDELARPRGVDRRDHRGDTRAERHRAANGDRPAATSAARAWRSTTWAPATRVCARSRPCTPAT